MRCSLSCFVVLLMMSTVVIGGSPMLKRSRRQLTRSSTERGRQTTQAEGGARRAGGAEGADALGDAFHQVAQGLQALQAAIRSQRQEETVALSALRQELEQRLQRLEETGGGRANAHSNEGSEVESWLAKLDGTVQRLLRHVPTEAPQEALEGPSVVQNDSSSSVSALTSPQSPSGSAVAAAATEAPPSGEEMRRRVAVRVALIVGGAKYSPEGEEFCTAVRGKNLEDVRRLLDSGADPNYMCSDGATPLVAAIFFSSLKSCQDVKMVLFLIERGADVNGVDRFGTTALHYAAAADTDGGGLAPLIAAGADVNARDLNGETPLHWAAKRRREGALRKLLAAGADRNIRAWDGDFKDKTPTDIAAPESFLQTSENSSVL